MEPGTSLGMRIMASVETAEGPTARANIELRVLAEGEFENMMWLIEGMPPSKIRVDRADGVHASAACMVNRIPDVIAAPPGIRLISQLGPLRPSLTPWVEPTVRSNDRHARQGGGGTDQFDID
jgi:4-hydroxy-tetrahydrodipicolinate reductase